MRVHFSIWLASPSAVESRFDRLGNDRPIKEIYDKSQCYKKYYDFEHHFRRILASRDLHFDTDQSCGLEKGRKAATPLRSWSVSHHSCGIDIALWGNSFLNETCGVAASAASCLARSVKYGSLPITSPPACDNHHSGGRIVGPMSAGPGRPGAGGCGSLTGRSKLPQSVRARICSTVAAVTKLQMGCLECSSVNILQLALDHRSKSPPKGWISKKLGTEATVWGYCTPESRLFAARVYSGRRDCPHSTRSRRSVTTRFVPWV